MGLQRDDRFTLHHCQSMPCNPFQDQGLTHVSRHKSRNNAFRRPLSPNRTMSPANSTSSSGARLSTANDCLHCATRCSLRAKEGSRHTGWEARSCALPVPMQFSIRVASPWWEYPGKSDSCWTGCPAPPKCLPTAPHLYSALPPVGLSRWAVATRTGRPPTVPLMLFRSRPASHWWASSSCGQLEVRRHHATAQ